MLTKAAVTFGKGEPFKITDIMVDDPRPGEVLVRLVGTGICHTDIIVRDQFYPVPLPAVLGHEENPAQLLLLQDFSTNSLNTYF
jgi:aryl-alcohol dehydrogenase